MAKKTMQLEIVSAEAAIFTGVVELIIVSGRMGELGIYPGHTALLTSLKPGQLRATLDGGQQEVFYIAGGMLEVQPEVVTVLADAALKAADLDEAAALAAKEAARRKMAEQKAGIEYSKAMTQLAEAAAQLRAIEMIRKQAKR